MDGPKLLASVVYINLLHYEYIGKISMSFVNSFNIEYVYLPKLRYWV